MFTPNSGANIPSGNNSLIPTGTLVFAVAKVLGLKVSKNTGGEYARLELTVSEGPYAKRKIWTVVMNPNDPINQKPEGVPSGATMALMNMCRMFEAAGVFNPLDARTYHQFNNHPFVDTVSRLDGLTVAFKVKITKGKEGRDDQNDVADFISPAPSSGTVNLWNQLTGDSTAARSSMLGKAVVTQQQPVAPIQPSQKVINKPNWLKDQTDNAGNNPY